MVIGGVIYFHINVRERVYVISIFYCESLGYQTEKKRKELARKLRGASYVSIIL